MPRWVEPMPSLICVNSKVFTSRTLLVFCQIRFQRYNFIEGEKWMKGYALEKWESTLNLVFMPMDAIYILSWKLLVTITISLITNIWYLWNDPLQSWFRLWLFFFDPFLGQLKALVFCRLIPQSNLYFHLSSSITPLVSQDYHGTTKLLMSSSSSATFSLISVFHGLWVIRHSRTQISESIPHPNSITLSNLVACEFNNPSSHS